ncbi:MAG: hypothetical protein DWQ36_12405 [Acidobacteria bacterium]|nr:MAG: hypothetical protein DWQ30_24800 [Acidobacteriota bacterium]REK07339.1 MAG: hypothetical protein DWQ36_12405 [Acidobacteriota bacterium]
MLVGDAFTIAAHDHEVPQLAGGDLAGVALADDRPLPLVGMEVEGLGQGQRGEIVGSGRGDQAAIRGIPVRARLALRLQQLRGRSSGADDADDERDDGDVPRAAGLGRGPDAKEAFEAIDHGRWEDEWVGRGRAGGRIGALAATTA